MSTEKNTVSLSTLKPPLGAKRTAKRIGRGQGSGTGVTAGRGDKGQQSRSGYSRKRGFEGGQMPIHRRLPKRGFHNIFRVSYEAINLDTLSERFSEGLVVTPDLLREQGLISRTALVKILARGSITKKLTVKAHGFSKKAAEQIVAAGGQVEVVARVKSKKASE